jgi:class 3 adenylate cyclase
MAAAISAACVSSGDLDELHGVAAGEGKELELAILFSDIRNFTTHSEKNLPYDVVHMLNRHFVAAAEPVLNNNGFIDGSYQDYFEDLTCRGRGKSELSYKSRIAAPS